jgi:hypothetical protein
MEGKKQTKTLTISLKESLSHFAEEKKAKSP